MGNIAKVNHKFASTFAAFISKAESVWLQKSLQRQKEIFKNARRTTD